MTEDNSDAALREQLRSFYVWPSGKAQPELRCREKHRPLVFTAGQELAARQLQTVIATRAREEIARMIRARNLKNRIPGDEQLEVLPAHLAPYAE